MPLLKGKALLSSLLGVRLREMSRRLKFALQHERFKLYVVLIIGGLIWFGVTEGLITGLRVFSIYPGLKEVVVSYLLGMFFFVIMVMLLFSSAIVSYGAFFGGAEIPFLLVGPVPAGLVYLYRLFFAFVFSAWAVMVMGLPVVIAYGIDGRHAWTFYAGALAVFAPFLVLTASAGGAAALLLARFLGKYRRSLAGVFVILAGLALFYVAVRWPEISRLARGFGEEWMFTIMGWFAFARNPWYPSTWAAKAVEAAAAGDWRAYTLYVYSLAAAALALIAAGRVLAELCYRRAYETAATASVRKSARLNAWLWRALHLFAFGSRKRAAFFYKDTVCFFRDPLQWGQAAVFFGLILIYFLGLKRFGRMDVFLNWRIVTVTLSFLSVALTMSTFTTRFAFPLVSMEMRVVWGVSGSTGRDEMVSAKFAWTAWGSGLTSVILLMVGARNMMVGRHAALVMAGAALGVSLALSAAAVGMGTLFPEPSRRSPSEMVSSFGGTVTLVASLLVVAAFTMAIVPALRGWLPLSFARPSMPPPSAAWAVAALQAVLLVSLGAAAAVFLVWLARQSARKLEW